MEEQDTPHHDKPVVGILAGHDNADEVAGSILRARLNGHDAIVGHDGREEDSEVVGFARELGAVVVGGDDPRAALAREARDRGYPGIIYQEASESVDYISSTNVLKEASSYGTEAVRQEESEVGVLVVIPAYNEEGTVAGVVEGAGEHADHVVVVDDGSTDSTAETAKQAGAEVVMHLRNRGYGSALRTAFREADKRNADALVILDGDGQHDPGDIPKLVEALGDADVIIGSRFVDGSDGGAPFYRLAGIKFVNMLTNISAGTSVADTQSGFRAYGPRAIEKLAEADIGDDMSASTDVLYHVQEQGYSVEEVATTVDYDVENANSMNPVSHGLELVNNILKKIEQDHPILVFGVPGVLSVLIGFGFAYWAGQMYLENNSFPVGLSMAATIFALVGVLSSFTAIILHSLNRHFK